MLSYDICGSSFAFIEYSGYVLSKYSDGYQLYSSEEQYNADESRKALYGISVEDSLHNNEYHIQKSNDWNDESDDWRNP